MVIDLFNETGPVHRTIGYVCTSLVLCRLIYGICLSQLSSVKFFFPTRHQALAHIRELRTGGLTSHYGHNPLGQWAVYMMWCLIILLAFTGWLSRTDAYWGEDWPVHLHQWLAKMLEIMVLLHLIAVVVMSVVYKQSLLLPMLTGKRRSVKHTHKK